MHYELVAVILELGLLQDLSVFFRGYASFCKCVSDIFSSQLFSSDNFYLLIYLLSEIKLQFIKHDKTKLPISFHL